MREGGASDAERRWPSRGDERGNCRGGSRRPYALQGSGGGHPCFGRVGSSGKTAVARGGGKIWVREPGAE